MIRKLSFGIVTLLAAVMAGGCSSVQRGSAGVAPSGPESTEWRLAEIGGANASTSRKRQPSLVLDAARKMASGFAGCNTFFGSYNLDKVSLKFGPLGSTRRVCAEEESALEASFLNALERCRGWKIKDGTLLMTVDDEVLARFETAAVDEAAPDPSSMTYRLKSVPSGGVTLREGKFQAPAAPDSASEMLVTLTGRSFGTIHGKEYGAAILLVSLGGTGSFHELALLSRGAKGWEGTDSILLGDRIRVHSLGFDNDRIVLAMTVHGPNDPQCCPTLEVTKHFAVKGGKLVAVGTETEDATSRITGTVWQWLSTRYANDTISAPAAPEKYTVRLLENGSLEVRADCNLKGGTYSLNAGNIRLVITHSTMAACERGSLEDQFVRDLTEGERCSIGDGELLIDLKNGRGMMKFSGAKER